jgi:hypothetical protein
MSKSAASLDIGSSVQRIFYSHREKRMKGQTAKIGDTYISDNGYEYTKTKKGWMLTHRLIAEAKLGRELKKGERVYFVDGDRSNLKRDNIEVRSTTNSKADKLARKKEQIRRLRQEVKDLEEDLK